MKLNNLLPILLNLRMNELFRVLLPEAGSESRKKSTVKVFSTRIIVDQFVKLLNL